MIYQRFTEMYQGLFLFILEYYAHDSAHRKSMCMSLHQEEVVYTDLMGFVPIFLCAN